MADGAARPGRFRSAIFSRIAAAGGPLERLILFSHGVTFVENHIHSKVAKTEVAGALLDIRSSLWART